jgi:L-ascorbate metabolism protein UlaG (beta-lactamase superfamily)
MTHVPTLTVTRLAHAGVLLDFAGTRVLTDPWFVETWMYHHGEPLGMEAADLPDLSAVAVSHNHYDHNDMAGFAAYRDHSVPIVMPNGASGPARKHGFTSLHELEPWQSIRLGDVTVTTYPSLHHQVPELTYVIEANGFRVYFGADSLLIPELRTLRERFGPFDLALLPCNGLIVRVELNKQVVMNAEEAASLCASLAPRYAVPIHYAFWGNAVTERLVIKHSRTGAADFLAAARRWSPETEVRILAPGDPLQIAPASAAGRRAVG